MLRRSCIPNDAVSPAESPHPSAASLLIMRGLLVYNVRHLEIVRMSKGDSLVRTPSVLF